MSDTIGEDQAVIVSYDRSDAGSEAIGTGSKTLVANFTTGENSVPAVVNNAEVDTSPPELTGATVTSSGDAIELAFGEDLDLPATIPAALKDAFSVTADGDTVEISGLAKDGSSGLQINPSSNILKDQAVIVSYDRSAAGTNALDDADGNQVASLTTGRGAIPAVDNNSTAGPATVTSATVNASGRALTIEFDKQINDPLGFAALFSITVDGVGHGVGNLQFLLSSPIFTGQAVVLSYAKRTRPPTALTAAALGATIVELAWTAPGNNGGSAITGYKVEVSTDGSTWTDLEDDTESTVHGHRLPPLRAVQRQHPALPGLGDQRERHVARLGELERHHHDRRQPRRAGPHPRDRRVERRDDGGGEWHPDWLPYG